MPGTKSLNRKIAWVLGGVFILAAIPDTGKNHQGSSIKQTLAAVLPVMPLPQQNIFNGQQPPSEAEIRKKIADEELQQRYARASKAFYYLSRTSLSGDDKHTISRGVLHDDVPCYSAFSEPKKLAVCEQVLRITFGIDRDSPKGDGAPERIQAYLTGKGFSAAESAEISGLVQSYKGCAGISDTNKAAACAAAENIWLDEAPRPPDFKISVP